MENNVQQLEVLKNPVAYASAWWRIVDKAGRRVPIKPTAAQKCVQYTINDMHKRGLQARIRVLKSRQQGISTWCRVIMMHGAMTSEAGASISIADKQDLPQQWLRSASKWYDETPDVLKPRIRASNLNELYFDQIDSRYWIGSDKGQTPGMGYTIRKLHCSELADWQNRSKIMADVMPSVTKVDKSAVIIEEGTGGVEGDEWSDAWHAADKGESLDEFGLDEGTVAIFLPSCITAEYVMNTTITPADYTTDERDAVSLANEWAKNNPTFAKIAGFKGLRPEHIQFRRWTIRNEFDGDVDLYRTKYPLSPVEAFLPVGRMAIPAAAIRQHQNTCHQGNKYRLDWVGDKVEAVPYDGSGIPWTIWHMPKEGCDYTIGGDVAEGLPSNPQDPRSDPDRSVGAVLNRRAMRTDAEMIGRPDADIFGMELVKAATFFNKGWMTPEVNNNGWATLAVCKGYENLYQREGSEESINERTLRKYGWKTGGGKSGTRNQMIDDWIALVRPDDVLGFQDCPEILSPTLAREEATFITTKNGKREHAPGCHDDCLFAWMIANQLHQQCPRQIRVGRVPRRASKTKLCYSGGHDPLAARLNRGNKVAHGNVEV
jgi:hypothetical protein